MKQEYKTQPTNVVFVIGAGRSGTTVLADLIGLHSECVKVPEKRYLWSYGAYWRSHDLRGPEDATSRISAYIRNNLMSRVNALKCRYLVEKTPSNCFRVGFLAQIFPKAKYIHIIRDGRDVAISSMRAFYGEKSLLMQNKVRINNNRSFAQRLAQFSQRFPQFLDRFVERDIPLSGWPSYIINNILKVWQIFTSNKPPLWGARFPGMEAARKAYLPIELAGMQWVESVSSAKLGLKKFVKPNQVLEVRYESLVSDPLFEMNRIFVHLGLGMNQALMDNIIKSVRPSLTTNQRDECNENWDVLMARIGPSLVCLNYEKLDRV